jgi:hypothetical protein
MLYSAEPATWIEQRQLIAAPHMRFIHHTGLAEKRSLNGAALVPRRATSRCNERARCWRGLL